MAVRTGRALDARPAAEGFAASRSGVGQFVPSTREGTRSVRMVPYMPLSKTIPGGGAVWAVASSLPFIGSPSRRSTRQCAGAGHGGDAAAGTPCQTRVVEAACATRRRPKPVGRVPAPLRGSRRRQQPPRRLRNPHRSSAAQRARVGVGGPARPGTCLTASPPRPTSTRTRRRGDVPGDQVGLVDAAELDAGVRTSAASARA